MGLGHGGAGGADSAGGTGGGGEAGAPLSALPSVRARVFAFVAIIVAGIAGALIGFSFIGLQCHGSCSTPKGLGALTGGAMAAGGVAVIAVLTLRAMGEWRTIKREQALAEGSGSAGSPGLGGGPSGEEDHGEWPPGDA